VCSRILTESAEYQQQEQKQYALSTTLCGDHTWMRHSVPFRLPLKLLPTTSYFAWTYTCFYFSYHLYRGFKFWKLLRFVQFDPTMA